MEYRRFGSLDFQVSALGFGCMRFPTRNGDASLIDEPEATRMLHYAIDHGVNYVDTAYPYHGGVGESFVGRVLQNGYRERVQLATKIPSWEIETRADFDRYLNVQLERLQTGHIDFYLLHSLKREWWHKLHSLGVLDWAEGAIADGRIRHLGFSFHDEYDAFQEIVDAYDRWALCQIQYNYMDVENQAGMRGLQYAASKGLAVVIMEPLLGGKLVDPPQSIADIWDMAANKRTRYKDLSPIPCTSCGYCMPCPNGVDIPGNLGVYNEGLMFNKPDASRGHYGWLEYAFTEQGILDHDPRAAVCVQCGECEEKCPQRIPISAWMPVIHEVLGEGKPYVTSP
jgi:predicted aldo/keto reductase-like oxidoreductase